MNVSDKWKALFTSRKFAAALATVATSILSTAGIVNVSEDTMMVILAVAVSFIVGTGIEDGAKALANSIKGS